jgi:hypothetical protein
MAVQVADEPTINADVGQPKVPFFLRRSGEMRVLLSPLTPAQVEDRFALYLGAGKSRQELARVQGRTVVASRIDGHLQMRSYRHYLRGVLATAFCVLEEASNGTRVLMSLSTMRYRRAYTVGLLTAGIVAILIFAPAHTLWLRTLLAFGILLVVSSWRLSRPTRETVEEKRFLAEFVRNLLDAEELAGKSRKPARDAEPAAMAKGQSG